MSYDPDQDQWRAHIRPSGQHISPSSVLWKDSILLCGGRGTSVIVEYNPDTEIWSEWKHQLPHVPKSVDCPPVIFAIRL